MCGPSRRCVRVMDKTCWNDGSADGRGFLYSLPFLIEYSSMIEVIFNN
jgi:hypothetical protein